MSGKEIRTALSAFGSRDGSVLTRNLVSYVRFAEQLSPTASRLVYSRVNQIVIDGVLIALSLTASYLLRFDGELPPPFDRQLLEALPFGLALCLGINGVSGVYNRIWRFFSLKDAVAVAQAIAMAFVVSVTWRLLDLGELAGTRVPLGVLAIFPFLTFGALVSARVARRVLYDRTMAAAGHAATPRSPRKRLLLAGAGEAGLYLLRELHDANFEVVGFVDDGEELQGRTIGGWRVLGTTHELEEILRTHRVDEVILCMPSAPKSVLQRIVMTCANLSVKTSTVPTLWEIMSGGVNIGQLRTVNMEDLLLRDRIGPPQDVTELTRLYAGKRILVTGAGGSIGSELVRQLRRFQPSQLVLLDKDENNLYEVTCEVREDFERVIEVVADIRNLDVMQKVFERHRPQVVFHAAAYKHVPLMESYPAEAILNNVMGTRHVATLSHSTGVETFVLISTDKAVNPSSMMGASKRVAEMIVQSLAASSTRTRFCCVRFGNVLGSRASVVPVFQGQISRRRTVTVTHPDVRRYFMTIPEAVQLVIQAGSLGEKGEIFLLDMGDPVRIVDLARNLIELSGLVPDRDVTIEFTGLRPGEKLDEELLAAGEISARSTKYSKIFMVGVLDTDWKRFRPVVADLERAAHADHPELIHQIVRTLDIGYHSCLNGDTPASAPRINTDPSVGRTLPPANLASAANA